jgi:hypothetical protein
MDLLVNKGHVLHVGPLHSAEHEQLQPRGPALPLTPSAWPEQLAAVVQVR